MDEILKMINRGELNNRFIKLEFCGNADPNLDDYYLVIDKDSKEQLIEFLGPESEAERIDMENNIQNGTIKDLIMAELDSDEECLTSHLIQVYGGIDELLMHYGLLESNLDYTSLYSEAEVASFEDTSNEDFAEDVTLEETEEDAQDDFNVSFEDNIPDVVFTDEDPKPAPKPVPESMELYIEITKIIAEQLGLKYDLIVKKAEARIDARKDPAIDRASLDRILDFLVRCGQYSEADRAFIIKSYESGNQIEVTELIGEKCKGVELHG